jgi:hypothetical protein
VRKEAYGTARPQCASNLIGVARLAFPEQLIEITFSAMLSGQKQSHHDYSPMSGVNET